jgi:hypothetical protein
MHDPKHDQSRAGFQLERFSFFSDGVFAIAITLLVIEIKVPALSELTDHHLWEMLSEMGFKFVGFLISFGIIGHYWSVHHRIFGYANRITTNLLWINLTFLLSVVLLPFSSGILGEYGSIPTMKIPYAVYVCNMVFTGGMNIWLWLYVSNPKRELLTRKLSIERINLGLYRGAIIPLVFIISFFLSFYFPVFAILIPLTIPIALHWGMKGFERRAELREKRVQA